MRQILKVPLDDEISTQLACKTTDKWKLSTKQRSEIFSKLYKSQKGLCCYCECRIKDNDYHIEHFIERDDDRRQIYNYKNLFLSCTQDCEIKQENETEQQREERIGRITCGHKKTKVYHNNTPIDYNLLLNPSNDINDEFMYPDSNIAENNKPNAKAAYTIKRLNLDSIKLNNSRYMAIQELINELEEIEDTHEQEKYMAYVLNEEVEELCAFYSTIKYNFSINY